MWVVKIGGSILDQHDDVIDPLIETMTAIATEERLLLIAGGGSAADVVRVLDNRRGLPELASHIMSILAMEMNAGRIAEAHPDVLHLTRDPIPGSTGHIRVLLPLETVLNSPLPASWQVTSDTISAYVAHLIGGKLVLLKDVDGVFETWPDGRLLASITPQELTSLRTSPVDPFLPVFLGEKHMEAWVLSGLEPERLESLISGRETLCTHIQG